MRREPGERRPRGERDWKRIAIWLSAALVVPFLFGYLIAVYVLFPPTQVSGSGISTPDLIGRTVPEAQRDLVGAGLGDMSVSELPHPDAAAGTIIAQSPLPGQQLRPGAGVRVALSSGRARVTVPDVLGFSADRAESLLAHAGFDVTRSVEESPAPEGRVIRTDPEPGQQRALPASVTLIVSAGPPETQDPGAFPDTTVAPDTTAARSR